jgi:hypothetical protein
MTDHPSRLAAPDVDRALAVAANSDSQLVLLVGDDPDVVRQAAEDAAAHLAWRSVELNRSLAEALIPLSTAERVEAAWDVFQELVGEHRDGVVLLNADILFEPTLQFRPYEALRRIGRSGPVVAPWFGRVEDRDVIHAAAGHPEYVRAPLDIPFVQVTPREGDR